MGQFTMAALAVIPFALAACTDTGGYGGSPGYYGASAYPSPGYYSPGYYSPGYGPGFGRGPGWAMEQDRWRERQAHEGFNRAAEGVPPASRSTPMPMPHAAPPPMAAAPHPAAPTTPQAANNMRLLNQLGFQPSH